MPRAMRETCSNCFNFCKIRSTAFYWLTSSFPSPILKIPQSILRPSQRALAQTQCSDHLNSLEELNAKIALLSAHSVRGVVWRVSTYRHGLRQGSGCPLLAALADPTVQLRLLLSLPSSVCLQVRFSRSEAWPLSALATGLRFAVGAATTTTRPSLAPYRSSFRRHNNLRGDPL